MAIAENCQTAAQREREAHGPERRQFVRIRLEAEIRYAKTAPQDGHAEPGWTTALLRDISGGGARLTTSEKVSVKEKVVLELPIDGKLICLHGCVQHVQPVKTSRAQKFDVGIQFIDLDEVQRSKIVGLVFRLQLNIERQNSQPHR